MAPDCSAHDDGDPHAIELDREPEPVTVKLTYRGPPAAAPRKPSARRVPLRAVPRVRSPGSKP